MNDELEFLNEKPNHKLHPKQLAHDKSSYEYCLKENGTGSIMVFKDSAATQTANIKKIITVDEVLNRRLKESFAGAQSRGMGFLLTFALDQLKENHYDLACLNENAYRNIINQKK